MTILQLFVLIIQIYFITGDAALNCPTFCTCIGAQNSTVELVCNGPTESENTTISKCNRDFNISTFSELLTPRISKLTINCFNLSSVNKTYLANFDSLTHLNIQNVYRKECVSDLFGNLASLLQLSITDSVLDSSWTQSSSQLKSLQSLHLSGNNIQNIKIKSSSLLRLNLTNNKIKEIQGLKNLSQLTSLDISNNPFILCNSGLHNLLKLSLLDLSNTSLQRQIEECANEFKFLPPNLKSFIASQNSLIRVPECNGLLAGITSLTSINLRNNDISYIDSATFQSSCYKNIQFIDLPSNRLLSIDKAGFTYLMNLQKLDISSNYIQHLPVEILNFFNNKRNLEKSLEVMGNPWSCDCYQRDLQASLLASNRTIVQIICDIPKTLSGKKLTNVPTKELICTDAVIGIPNNVSAEEYEDGKLSCSTDGIRKPIVTWISPKGELVSIETLQNSQDQRDKFALSPFGEVLTVKNVKLDKTGIYRCFAKNNNISIVNATVALSVYLSHTSTIIYIVVACCAFMVAITVNSINMCMYIYEHIQKKRLYKKAIREQEEELKLNPPIRQKTKLMDESLASLNAANRYYGRYDYTCQNMFLDSFIKGAHTVKKTIYDARHSEFSNNMWEYAAHIKDRLHIEMPGVSMPNITMPSISMPTISMPSIPTIQDINTNIEKLSSSMMQRSQTLATSVGSVFTMRRRWMWQQQNSSDTDSRDSDDNLEEAGITRVTVHVHNNPVTPDHSPAHHINSSNNRFDEMPGCSTQIYNTELDSHIGEFSGKTNPKIVRFSPHHNATVEQDPNLLQNPESFYSVEDSNPVLRSNEVLVTVSGAIDDQQLHSYETSV